MNTYNIQKIVCLVRLIYSESTLFALARKTSDIDHPRRKVAAAIPPRPRAIAKMVLHLHVVLK